MTITMKKVQPNELRREAARGALMLRCLKDTGMSQDRINHYLPVSDRGFHGDEVADFGNMTLLQAARQWLIAEGNDRQAVLGLPKNKLAQIALGNRSDPAFHVTSDFSNLTLDAFNKTLVAGYQEAKATWPAVFQQADSVDDFKEVTEVRLGAIQNLPVWPENTDPAQASIADEKVNYGVEARALEVSFSWQLMTNDDTNAIASTPFALGAAAFRTVNAIAWRQITSNPQLGDGQALYLETPAGNRKQGNLLTGAATPTVSIIGLMKAKMRLFRAANTREGSQSDAILNVEPTIIAGPAALEGAIDQLLFSTADPATNLSSVVFNPFTGLTKVIEPLLDENSSSAFYIFADPEELSAAKIVFLRGQEQPIVNSWVDKRNWSQHFVVRQSYGAKATDFRGTVKHNGV